MQKFNWENYLREISKYLKIFVWHFIEMQTGFFTKKRNYQDIYKRISEA